MAKVENRTMIKGFINNYKKWNNMGVPRSKVGGMKGSKTDQAVKRDKFKA